MEINAILYYRTTEIDTILYLKSLKYGRMEIAFAAAIEYRMREIRVNDDDCYSYCMTEIDMFVFVVFVYSSCKGFVIRALQSGHWM